MDKGFDQRWGWTLKNDSKDKIIPGRIIGIRHWRNEEWDGHAALQHPRPHAYVPLYHIDNKQVIGEPQHQCVPMDVSWGSRMLYVLMCPGDRIAMSASRTADALAFEIAQQAHKVGATVHRIPWKRLKEYLEASTWDGTRVLENTLRFCSWEFVEVTPDDVRRWRDKKGLDQGSFGF